MSAILARGFEFGQTERLTRRLHKLVRSYPPGVGILKEFIQNADDAGARVQERVKLDPCVIGVEAVDEPAHAASSSSTRRSRLPSRAFRISRYFP